MNEINKVVNTANRELKQVSNQVQKHGFAAEIHTAATYNIDAIEKSIPMRAAKPSDYHSASDINLQNINSGKTVHQI